MIREFLFKEYVLLGRHLTEAGAGLEAADCAVKALRLSPDNPEAKSVLQAAAAAAAAAAPQAGDDRVSRLIRRKQKLDAILAADPGLSGASQALPDSPPPSTADPDAEMTDLWRRLYAIKTELEKDDRPQASQALDTINEVIEEHGPRGGVPAGPDADRRSDWDDEFFLSAEHRLHNLANDFYKAGKFEVARDLYGGALDLNEKMHQSHFNRGLAYIRLRRYDDARADLTRTLDLDPCDDDAADAAYTRGLAWEYEGRYDDAIEDYKRALEFKPDYEKARTQMEIAQRRKLEAEKRPAKAPGSSSSSEDRIVDFSSYLCRPAITLAQVGGNREAKRLLRLIGAHVQGHEAFRKRGAVSPRGVMLYGPPGTGKTLLAKALAGECKVPFYATPSTLFLNQYYGNTEENLRSLWNQASSHDDGGIIFIDEFEALGTLRSNVRNPRGDDCHNKAVACLLDLMDGMSARNRVLVLAATNLLRNVDDAFLRPGRFNYKVLVPLPNAEELAEILLIHLEMAEQRAETPEQFCEALRAAIRQDRGQWLLDQFKAKHDDPSGVVRLARVMAQHEMTGADVEEIVNRAIMDTVAAEVMGIDPGPITPEDLERHMNDYLQSRKHVQEETGS